jgi:alkylation response protein AidB-like acyl-CoA dehydrogenase
MTAALALTPPSLTPPPRLDALREIIAADLAPLARSVDEEGFYPEAALRALGGTGAFSAHADAAEARRGLPAAAGAMAEIGAACGSTAFCAWCQDALVWYLANTPNTGLRARVLPALASGAQLGGTGLSNPMKALSGLERLALKGERVAGGWRVNGKLPWVSNLGPDHMLATIFEAGESKVMALFSCAHPGVSLLSGGAFIGLEGTRTYSVLMRDVFVPDDDVLAETAAAFVAQVRQGFILLQMGMALGAARAAAQQMRRDAAPRAILARLPLTADEIDDRAETLAERVAERARFALDSARPAFLETLRLRLDGSRLALEAAQANLVAHGARGYLKGSRAARLQREAHFVAIVSPSIKHILTELERG